MRIVINIPEDVYTRLFDNGIQDNEIAVDDVCEMARAIRLGIPLPKGHGRLVDTDKLKRAFISWSMAVHGIFTDSDIASIVYNSPTIIEADKEVEE